MLIKVYDPLQMPAPSTVYYTLPILLQKGDCLAQVVVHHQADMMSRPEIRHPDQPQALLDGCIGMHELLQPVWGLVEEIVVEDHVRVVQVNCQREDLRLHQILEEVRAEGRFRSRANAFPGQLHQ